MIMEKENDFTSELLEYNRLFDECRKLDYSCGKKYNEETRPVMERADSLGDIPTKTMDRITSVMADLDRLGDVTTNKAYKDFVSFDPNKGEGSSDSDSLFEPSELSVETEDKYFTNSTFERIDCNGDKSGCLKDLDAGAEIVKSLRSDYECPEAQSLLDAYSIYRGKIASYHRTFFLFRGTGLWVYLISGFIALIALFSLLIYSNIATTIASSILLLVFGGALVARLVYDLLFAKKRASGFKAAEKELSTSLDRYFTAMFSLLNSERNDSFSEYSDAMDECHDELKKIGDKWEEKLQEETKEIRAQMESHEVIHRAINRMIDCFGDEIHYSKDYMSLFESSVYLRIETEKQFLEAVRAVIEERRREVKEKEEKEQKQRADEERRREERMERDYQARMQREALREQQRQTEALERQQEAQRKAARSLCFSCKFNNGCSLKRNLSSPVCSKFQSKH